MTAADYRISGIQRMTLNAQRVKVFSAYRRQGFAFIFCGRFSATVSTPDSELWRIADAAAAQEA